MHTVVPIKDRVCTLWADSRANSGWLVVMLLTTRSFVSCDLPCFSPRSRFTIRRHGVEHRVGMYCIASAPELHSISYFRGLAAARVHGARTELGPLAVELSSVYGHSGCGPLALRPSLESLCTPQDVRRITSRADSLSWSRARVAASALISLPLSHTVSHFLFSRSHAHAHADACASRSCSHPVLTTQPPLRTPACRAPSASQVPAAPGWGWGSA